MTRLYLSADLEGACGVTSPSQCYRNFGNEAAYREAVDQLVQELTWVIEAALAEGATHILLNDAHGPMVNLTRAQFPQAAVTLLSGKPKFPAMMAGLDKHYDAVFLLGYHAKAGTQNGILAHTFHDGLADVTLNGHSYGEGYLNALYAAQIHGVPTLLASGDNVFCTEIQTTLPQVQTVVTKDSLGYSAAKNRPTLDLKATYQAQVKRVFQQKADWKKQLLPKLKAPYRLAVTLNHPRGADVVATLPGAQRHDGVTVAFEGTDLLEIYKALQSSYMMLAYLGTLG